jgi:hypothetical protein
MKGGNAEHQSICFPRFMTYMHSFILRKELDKIRMSTYRNPLILPQFYYRLKIAAPIAHAYNPDIALRQV